jgi:glycosyltransferase involved in cell wall biosynthesis
MRIALLPDRFPPDPGGLANAAARIAGGLARRGHAVDVYAVDPAAAPGTLGLARTAAGVSVRRAGAHRREEDTSAALLDALASAHAASPYDVVHGLYVVRSGFLAAYAGGWLGAASVVSARGNDLDRAVLDPARTAAVLFALGHATVVTAVSAELGDKARALAPGARVEVVPNGVDAALFRPLTPARAARRSYALDGRAVIGFAGELRHKKGLVVLLDALAALAARRPVALHAAGGVRADAEGALALYRARHPEAAITVLPWRPADELPPLYALMDVFVHPSLHDGMPNALLEAMACARPVVAAAAGGIPDVVRDGTDGLLVPPGDAAALAAAVERVLDDRPRAARLGEAGRARVARDFTPEAEAARYEALYRQAAAARRTSSGGGPARVAR